MLPTQPLQLTCPRCQATAIAYSCEPRCCFNHVCVSCRCTFQTATEYLGSKLAGLTPPDPAPDTSDPTAQCSECRSIAVHQLSDGRIACTRCGALLALSYEDIA
jgi:hypothetical protein